MSEFEPKGPPQDQDINPLRDYPEAQEVIDFVRQHKNSRKIANILVWSLYLMRVISTQDGREQLKNPEVRNFFLNKEGRIGMLEGAITNYELYYPNEENQSLTKKVALAGRWVSYDFYRKQEFGEKAKHVKEGRLVAFLIDEVSEKQPEDYTPTGLLNVFDIDHLLHVQTPTIEQLVELGFIKETTYEAAFSTVGIYQRFNKLLTLNGIKNSKIYTVTPKGNGLVFTLPDEGNKVESPDRKAVLEPSLNPLFS